MLIFTIILIVVGITTRNDSELVAVFTGVLTLFFGYVTFLPSTTLEEDTVVIRTSIVAFEDDTNTKIYGQICGDLFYVQGTIQSEQQYTLTVLSLDGDNKATFKYFDVDEVNMYFVESDEAYYEYSYITETKVIMLFNKQIGKPEKTKHLKEINVYLPIGSVKYDNQING